MFKIGDRVWCYSMQKKGKVKSVTKRRNGFSSSYPIRVKFKNGVFENFTKDGRFATEDKAPDLFKKEMVMVEKNE